MDSVLIITETDRTWETFSTWYSFYKNSPNAKITIASKRNGKLPFQTFQWAKKLKDLNFFEFNQFSDDEKCNWIKAVSIAKSRGFVYGSLLVVEPFVMALEPIPKIGTDRVISNHVWYMKEPKPNDMLNGYMLGDDNLCDDIEEQICYDANSTDDIKPLVYYGKGCGKWIHTLKGCPFSNAEGLISDTMTVNEKRVIEMWKKMVSLYSILV